ncbi:hypothetical protein ElyMa_000629200 [Elysia marginata]|uniref:Uncharacterized protein n=1 Tax=Elysia marginata TaxID=1093978 RepID=A0AAV4GBW3_9GAST|nr:hypothetical protein ElyMa_000629200 [Elysia marginata]
MKSFQQRQSTVQATSSTLGDVKNISKSGIKVLNPLEWLTKMRRGHAQPNPLVKLENHDMRNSYCAISEKRPAKKKKKKKEDDGDDDDDGNDDGNDDDDDDNDDDDDDDDDDDGDDDDDDEDDDGGGEEDDDGNDDGDDDDDNDVYT